MPSYQRRFSSGRCLSSSRMVGAPTSPPASRRVWATVISPHTGDGRAGREDLGRRAAHEHPVLDLAQDVDRGNSRDECRGSGVGIVSASFMKSSMNMAWRGASKRVDDPEVLRKIGSPSLTHIELFVSRRPLRFVVFSRRYVLARDFRLLRPASESLVHIGGPLELWTRPARAFEFLLR